MRFINGKAYENGYEIDPLGPAKGIINGCLMGLCFWGVVSLIIMGFVPAAECAPNVPQYECYKSHTSYDHWDYIEVKTTCRYIYKKGTKPKDFKNKPMVIIQRIPKEGR